jgi:hypothetical protein
MIHGVMYVMLVDFELLSLTWTLHPQQIFVFEDTVLLLHEHHLHKEFSLYRIPPLRPVLGIFHPLACHAEIFRLHSPNQWCCASSQSTWFRSYTDDTHHLDLLGIANNGEHGIARYVLKHINRNGDLDLPPFIPNLSLLFLPHQCYPEFAWVREFDSTRLWDDSALLIWMEDQTLVANLSQIFPKSLASSARSGAVDSPTPEDGGKERDDRPWASGTSTSIILCDNINQARRGTIAHCPMSGRLCVLSSNEIHVMDYLVPPA